MARRYGNVSSSSLLSAAKAAYNKQQDLQDQIAGYEWDLSPKDQASYQKYADYLGKRVREYQSTDPNKSLSYQKQITGAQRGFTSSEIGRATTQVLYGNISNRQKLSTLTNLYNQAAANGDENLAQRIEQQWARLSMTIQSEEMGRGGSGGGGGGSASSAASKGYNQAIAGAKRYVSDAENLLKQGKITQQQYAEKVMKAAHGDQASGIPGLYEVYQQAQNDPSLDAETASKLQSAYMDMVNSDKNTKAIADYQRFASGGTFNPSQGVTWDPTTRRYKIADVPKADQALQPGMDLAQMIGSKKDDKTAMLRKIVAVDDNGNPIMENGKPVVTNDRTLNIRNFSETAPGGNKYARELSAVTGKEVPILSSASLGGDPNKNPFGAAGAYAFDAKGNELLPKDVDKNGNPVYRPWMPQDFPTKNEGLWDGFKQNLSMAKTAVSDIFRRKTQNDIANQVNSFARELGQGNILGATFNFASNPIGVLSRLSAVRDQLATQVAQKREAERQAEIKRQADFAANQRAIQEANARQAAYNKQVAQQQYRYVALPYLQTPQGKAASQVIGSNAFNQKYLGSPFTGKSIYNMF